MATTRTPALSFIEHCKLLQEMNDLYSRLNAIYFYTYRKNEYGATSTLSADDRKELQELDEESFRIRKRVSVINDILKNCYYTDYEGSEHYAVMPGSLVKVLIYEKPSDYEGFFRVGSGNLLLDEYDLGEFQNVANVSLVSPYDVIGTAIMGKKPGEEFTYHVNGHTETGRIIYVQNTTRK